MIAFREVNYFLTFCLISHDKCSRGHCKYLECTFSVSLVLNNSFKHCNKIGDKMKRKKACGDGKLS